MMTSTTRAVLVKSWSIFTSPSSFPLYLLLSALLFSFRSSLHLTSLSLSSTLDRDPHLLSLLSRLSSSSSFSSHNNHHQQSDPFHSLPTPKTTTNNLNNNNNLSFLLPDNPQLTVLTLHLPRNNHNPNSPLILSFLPTTTTTTPSSRPFSRRDALSILHVACLFSVAHLYSILFFLLSYSLSLASVFLASSSALLHLPTPPSLLPSASRLGLRRLPLLLFLRWSLRDALAQLLSLLLLPLPLPHPPDHLSLLKLFLRLKLLPFSLTALPPPPSPSSSSFALLFSLLDLPLSALFSFNCWVALLHHRGRRRRRRSGRELLREGCRLAYSAAGPVVVLKLLEAAACGDLGMRAASMVLGVGPALAMAGQSVVEVYFMVAWLVLYLTARSDAGDAGERRFGWRELREFYNESLREDRRDE